MKGLENCGNFCGDYTVYIFVDGSEIRRDSPVEVGGLPYYFQRFIYIYIYPRISEPSTVSVDLTPQPPGCVHGGIHEGLGWDPFLRCP